jgi:hypothetical protein
MNRASFPSVENREKARKIRPWIDPDERITVDFEDEKDLNAVVTGCSTETVGLALETSLPHLRQDITIPLSEVEIGEDRARYTRDPAKPLQYGRLKLTMRLKRPQVV